MQRKPFWAVVASTTLLAAACGGSQAHVEEPDRGPVESAGESADQAAGEVYESDEELIDETGDAFGDLGDATGEAVEDVDGAAEDAGEELGDGFD